MFQDRRIFCRDRATILGPTQAIWMQASVALNACLPQRNPIRKDLIHLLPSPCFEHVLALMGAEAELHLLARL